MEKAPEIIGWVFQQSGVVIVLLICGWILWQKFLPMLQAQQEKYEASLREQLDNARASRRQEAEQQNQNFQNALDKILQTHERSAGQLVEKIGDLADIVKELKK